MDNRILNKEIANLWDEIHLMIIGSLSNQDGKGCENVSWKGEFALF